MTNCKNECNLACFYTGSQNIDPLLIKKYSSLAILPPAHRTPFGMQFWDFNPLTPELTRNILKPQDY